MARPRMTGDDLRSVAAALHGSPIGSLPALARRLDQAPRLVRRWASGHTPIPDDVAKLLDRLVGVGQVAPESMWRRDEWVMGEGPPGPSGQRREYLFHLWPPRFRCRVVEIDPETEKPVPGEKPADLIEGVVYRASLDSMLAEFEWQDRPPRGERLVLLVEAAADALDADVA